MRLALATVSVGILLLSQADPCAQSDRTSRRALSATVTVAANKPSIDSGLDVTKGESLLFCATGEIVISKDRVTSGPAGIGAIGDHDQRLLPVATLPVGGLIGSVEGRFFRIGNEAKPIKMVGSGALLLGVNDWTFFDNSGAFRVRLIRSSVQRSCEESK